MLPRLGMAGAGFAISLHEKNPEVQACELLLVCVTTSNHVQPTNFHSDNTGILKSKVLAHTQKRSTRTHDLEILYVHVFVHMLHARLRSHPRFTKH